MSDGMTLIVKSTARLVSGFIVVFGVYTAMTGHLGPGGGFAGGVILAAAAALIVLAFGGRYASRIVSRRGCHLADAAGAGGFLAIALCGFFVGTFFADFLPPGRLHHLASAGTVPLSNLAILVKVAAGVTGAFLALTAFHGAGAIFGRPSARAEAKGPQPEEDA